MTEQEAIEQLSNYKRLQARMHLLSNYSVGAGITVSRLNEDDQLQELHRKLRGLPSYMYLSKREQKLETVAHTYLNGKYPSGIQSQQRAVQVVGYDEEDTKLLQELRQKITRVFEARGYDVRDDLDSVLQRVAELQDVRLELCRIDNKLDALEKIKPDYARLLRHKYVDQYSINKICLVLSVSDRTYRRWYKQAITEFAAISKS